MSEPSTFPTSIKSPRPWALQQPSGPTQPEMPLGAPAPDEEQGLCCCHCGRPSLLPVLCPSSGQAWTQEAHIDQVVGTCFQPFEVLDGAFLEKNICSRVVGTSSVAN